MLNVYHYFQRACERSAAEVRGLAGEKCMDEEGNTAVFWIGTKAGKITSAGYRCTTCFTLLALCEHVCEMLAGSAVEDVLEITPARLLSLHPEIPSERHGRARLAVEAVRSALKRHTKIGGVLV